MKKLVSLLFTLILVGCTSNPFTSSYEDVTDGDSVSSTKYQKLEEGQEPQVMKTDSLKKDMTDIYEEGYEMLGHSSFNSSSWSDSAMKTQAKNVGATLVLYSKNFTGQEVDVNYDPWFNDCGGYYGVSGRHSYYSHRNYYCDPFDWYYTYENRYDYVATFWAKAELTGLGLVVMDLKPETRKEIERNTGVEVIAIRKDSDAFRENIIPGDIITEIDGKTVATKKDFKDMMKTLKGKSVTVGILRNGKNVSKTLDVI